MLKPSDLREMALAVLQPCMVDHLIGDFMISGLVRKVLWRANEEDAAAGKSLSPVRYNNPSATSTYLPNILSMVHHSFASFLDNPSAPAPRAQAIPAPQILLL